MMHGFEENSCENEESSFNEKKVMRKGKNHSSGMRFSGDDCGDCDDGEAKWETEETRGNEARRNQKHRSKKEWTSGIHSDHEHASVGWSSGHHGGHGHESVGWSSGHHEGHQHESLEHEHSGHTGHSHGHSHGHITDGCSEHNHGSREEWAACHHCSGHEHTSHGGWSSCHNCGNRYNSTTPCGCSGHGRNGGGCGGDCGGGDKPPSMGNRLYDGVNELYGLIRGSGGAQVITEIIETKTKGRRRGSGSSSSSSSSSD